MRLIIAGSRSIESREVVFGIIEHFLSRHEEIHVTEVVSGKAHGVDSLGEEWAKSNGVPVKPFPAAWRVNGVYRKSAGMVRNGEMARYADGLLAIWDGESNGTANMILQMGFQKKLTQVVTVRGNSEPVFWPQ